MAAVSLLVAFLLAWAWAHRPHTVARHAVSAPVASATVVVPAVERRKVYPYSVIPGGAYSNYELVKALSSDPVAARHYQGFGLVDVKLVAAPGQAVYMSYRKGDQVYWTSHPVRLIKGELLLTDGANCARARCGNRLSPQPMSPTSASGPTPEELNQPEQPLVDYAAASRGGTLFPVGPAPEAIPSPLLAALTPVNVGPILIPSLPLAPGISPIMFPGGLPPASSVTPPLLPVPPPPPSTPVPPTVPIPPG
ncbi:MAG: hypothetical protein ABSH49_26520, partial [Bryobacteraceae bacterium]